MKYFKRLKVYKAENVVFNPETFNAYSYDWWRFVARIDGLVVFNNFRYSVTTAKHQRKVGLLLAELGIKVSLRLTLPRGIRHDQTLAEMIVECEEHLCDQYLESEMKREARNERARARRAAKRDAEFEKAAAFMAEYAAENKLTIVEPGVGTYTIGKAMSHE